MSGRDVLTVTEHRRGEIRTVSFELIAADRQLAGEIGGALHVAVIGGDVDTYADRLNRRGVDELHAVDYGDEFNHDVYTGSRWSWSRPSGRGSCWRPTPPTDSITRRRSHATSSTPSR